MKRVLRLELQWGRDQLIAEFRFVDRVTKPQPWWLQWGRDQLIAELLARQGQLTEEALLQWGRDQLIAELRSHCRCCRTTCNSFNGAAIS